MTTGDMEIIKRKTNHVVGTPKSMGGSGDPLFKKHMAFTWE